MFLFVAQFLRTTLIVLKKWCSYCSVRCDTAISDGLFNCSVVDLVLGCTFSKELPLCKQGTITQWLL